MNVVAPFEGIGASVRRKEDLRFLSGRGQYTDDIARPGQAHAFILRSPHAHARIVEAGHGGGPRHAGRGRGLHRRGHGRSSAASPAAGASTTRTARPWRSRSTPSSPRARRATSATRWRWWSPRRAPQAKDAAEAIEVEYDVLPALPTMQEALAPGAPLLHDNAPGNLCYDWHIGDKAVTDAAFASAHKVVRFETTNNRLVPNAMEPRSAIGEYDRDHGRAHALDHQPEPARHPPADGRLRAEHPGVASCAWWRRTWAAASAARSTTTPRRRSSPGRRAQAAPPGEVDLRPQRGLHLRRPRPRPRHHLRAGAGRGRQVPRPPRPHPGQHGRLPLHLRALRADLPLRDPARRRVRDAHHLRRGQGGVHQHRRRWTPIAAPAGRRRPTCWSGWWTSRRRRPGIDRVEIRRRNFIPTDAFPYQTPVALQYDSGDYHATLDQALEAAGWSGFEARRAEAAKARASCAASASPPTSRPAASRPRPWSARSAPAPGSTRWAPSASTRPAASPC